jgi:endoglucanase
MLRTRATWIAATALVGMLVAWPSGGTARAAPSAGPDGKSDLAEVGAVNTAAPPAWLVQAWSSYKGRFIKAGRVIDNVNGISHSEGQGYAMLLAARAGDRESFDELWTWTRTELMGGSVQLAAWRWDPKAKPHVTDPNNATDGDLLLAWALIEGARRWSSADYADAARILAARLAQETVADTPVGRVLLPGRTGFREKEQPDGPVLNLSYWVLPALEHLNGLAPEAGWSEIEARGLALIRASRFGLMRLPANWISVQGGKPQPAAGYPRRFGYDSIRIPLYLAWGRSPRPADLRIFAGLWNEAADIGPFVIDLDSGAAVENLNSPGFKAVAAVVSCALQGRKLPEAVRTVALGDYYPTTLHLLSLVAVNERYPQCL